MSTPSIDNIVENGAKWLYTHWPQKNVINMEWCSVEHAKCPSYVCDYIENNWVKINTENGGTYQKPEIEKEKTFGTSIQNSNLYQGMDDANKKATDVMANEGMKAAVEHMLTDPDTKRPLSYSEMRSRYG